ncbi:ATP-dependent 6-phosphofructokinase [Actinomyces massiliensis]|uniref:6-phosphofructokinase n=1 Tax=Actinomyces massiliensis TaxID=461393 RepID=UPI0028E1ED27|nr:ATP-dependent 6-phosphofructokinase [Actinomyces massiliensis]
MATKRIGILTAGGDAPGLNAAIRGFGKAAIQEHGWKLIGFRDGMRGLAENRFMELDGASLSGILTTGGTMLGTSRDKVHRMVVDGETRDMIPTIVENCEKNKLDALVCLGGGGTAKNARRLMEAGLNVLHLPKTIDNDIVETETSFGFATALEIATEAVDRLHSTAHSHHRIILTEIMGHRAGWLALGAGIAGGADVILLPEIPYSVEAIADKIERRRSYGSTFSVVAVAEGALNVADREEINHAEALVKDASSPEAKAAAKRGVKRLEASHRANTFTLAEQLEAATGLEARVSILGYVQRGGTPNAADRLLGTRLGVAGAHAIADGKFGVMVGDRGHGTELVPLKRVAGKVKYVPRDHEWIRAARAVGTALGD